MSITTLQQASDYLAGLSPTSFQRHAAGQATSVGTSATLSTSSGQATSADSGQAPSLDRMRVLLETLGNPHLQFPTIHIGGTAGKGSTATLAAAMLARAGYKTGLHISPHLQDIRERMRINGQLVSDESFIALINEIVPVVTSLTNTEQGQPTYFEVTLAMSFTYFAQQHADIAVIEVGLGGTFDGTNVITPLVSVLTNVELDHTEILGDTVEAIAHDKVGIFKPGVPIVTAVTQPTVITIVEEHAKETASKVLRLGRDFTITNEAAMKEETFFTLQYASTKRTICMHISGLHQARNASLAIVALEQIKQHGFAVTDESIFQVLAQTKIPGRFEYISEEPTIILDGAHNPAKVAALVKTLKDIYKDKKVTFVVAVKKGKNVAEMLALLDEVAEKFYFTEFLQQTDFGKSQSLDATELQSLVKAPTICEPNAQKAVELAKKQAKPTDIICITGSLYLVGELRSLLIPPASKGDQF